MEYTSTGKLRTTARATLTHCKNGHEWTQATIYLKPGTTTRQCKTCKAATIRKIRERQARTRLD